jgi:hypothetical protein
MIIRLRGRIVGIAVVFVACNAASGPGSSGDGVLDATWTAPTTNRDGSPLTDLVSYRVYYSTTNPPCPDGPFITVKSLTARPAAETRASVRLKGLTMGQLYYVAIGSVNSRGVMSGCTPVASARARRP